MIISGWRTSHASLYTDTTEYSVGYNRSRPCRRAWKPTNPKKTIQKAKPNVNDLPNLLTACFDAVNHPVTDPSAKPSDTLEAHPITPCIPTSLDPHPSFPAITPHPLTTSQHVPPTKNGNPCTQPSFREPREGQPTHPTQTGKTRSNVTPSCSFSGGASPSISGFALSLSKGRPFVVSPCREGQPTHPTHERTYSVTPNNERPCPKTHQA